MKPFSFKFWILSLVLLFPVSALAQRVVTPLDKDWKFIRQDVPLESDFSTWETVPVPHTWNARDGQNGKAADPQYPAGYYRGPGWYAKELTIPADGKGKRIFIRFEAASLVADVWLNGTHLGQHRGGYTAFCFELTAALSESGKNVLRVKVDNSPFEDVIPLSGDFTVFGGLCRPVELITTDSICISPLDFGSSGVYLTQKKITSAEAEIEAEVKVSNALPSGGSISVQTDWIDAEGATVKTGAEKMELPPNTTTSVKIPLSLEQPHLWQGRSDPYLYQVRVRLLSDNRLLDEITETTGLRTVQITNEQGFLLNGLPYSLHGVNWHEERQDKGRALSRKDLEEDEGLIVKMGATCLRLAHYPQRDYFLSLCDRSGLVLWQEIPVVERVNDSPAFAETTKLQLKEMILQGYNHPSLSFWGIYNELLASWLKVKPVVDPLPLLKELAAEVHALDPSRLLVAASWTTNTMSMHSIPDWQSFNTYPGWYWGKVDDFTSAIDTGSANLGGKRIAISEYGAGANITQHELGMQKGPKPGGSWHPEEWQALTHEAEWAQAKNNPKLWGTFAWVMFDFASDGRNEGGTPGINDKGLVSHDHKTPKDAFYFYQANWSDEPMVYITSRRMTERTDASTEIKVYSNCEEVELKVDGLSRGKLKPDANHTIHWPQITLSPGKNKIEVIGKKNGDSVTDSCEWTLEATKSP